MAESEPSAAEALKTEGNKLFQACRYHEAVEKYNDAIELSSEVPAYYTNRAFCHLKLENHGLAIADATVALELDRTFVKAYYRRGSALMALGKCKEALKDFKAVRQLKPNDRDALEKFKACEKEVKRAAFERAIHADEPAQVSVAEQIQLENISVDDSYAGPRLEWPLTHEQALEVAQWLKRCEKLHHKYVFEVLLKLKEVLEELPSLVDSRSRRGRTSTCAATRTASSTTCSTSLRRTGTRRRRTRTSSTATLWTEALSRSR